MSLFLATILPGIFLLGVGVLSLLKRQALAGKAHAATRSMPLGVLLFGGASIWFLYKILHLGEADFGNHRTLLFLVFSIVALGSFVWVRDFLAVRGAAVLYLLTADLLLDAAYMQWETPQRLLLVVGVYVGIVLALWVGAMPFRARDFLEWVFAGGKAARVRNLGVALTAYGSLLCIVAFTY